MLGEQFSIWYGEDDDTVGLYATNLPVVAAEVLAAGYSPVSTPFGPGWSREPDLAPYAELLLVPEPGVSVLLSADGDDPTRPPARPGR